MTCAELSALVVRDAIEAAPIAPLSLEARAVGDVGTMTLPNRIADTVEDTSMGDSYRSFKTTLKGWSGSVDVFWDETDTTGQGGLVVGAQATISVFPEGASAGVSEKYYTGTATVTGKTITGSFDGMVESTITLQGTGTRVGKILDAIGWPSSSRSIMTGQTLCQADPGTTRTALAAIETATFTGLVDISAAGAGQIQFPATQNASTNANTLDDYEEGTWTPGFAFGGNAVGVTYTAGNSGIYTKIGRVVTVIANVALTNKGSSTGNATITGLPFTAATGAEPNYSAVSFGNVSFLTFVEVPVATVGGGETVIYLREITSAGGGTALTNADFDNQTQTRITVSYFVS